MRKYFRALWRILTAPFRLLYWVGKQIVGFLRGFFWRVKNFWVDESEAVGRPTSELISDILDNPREVLPQFLPQIIALRRHLLRAVIGLLLTTVAAFAFAPRLLEIIAQPIGGLENVQAVEVTESLGVFMRVSLLAGFVVASPYMILELLLFVAPGLKLRERRIGCAAIPVVTLLFVGGMAFAYFVMLEPALGVLIGFMDIPTKVRPSSYYPFVISLMFWIGVSFEFPVVMLVLSYMRILRARVLLENTRVAVVILAVLAAAITPTVDPINMLLVWGPLVVLYFLGLGLAFLGERARGKQSEEQ